MSEPFRFGVIGRQIEYSLSPRIFEAIFAAHDTTGTFEVISLGDEPLAGALRRLGEEGFTGLSVTIPYKRSAVALLEEVDPVANQIGAVNSISISRASRVGYNTDWIGFLAGLPIGFHVSRDARVLVLGNGGSADAVMYALLRLGLQGSVQVLGRSDHNVASFCQKWDGSLAPRLQVMPAGQLQGTLMDLIINCTPVGGPSDPEGTAVPPEFIVAEGGLYYDLNYNRENRTVAAMKAQGKNAVDGSVMLVAQAIESFRIWTGLKVTVPEVYRAVFGERT